MSDEPNSNQSEDAAGRAKALLRHHLKAAMRDRDSLVLRVIRGLIAALDNAEAVPVGDRHEYYVVHAFGDRSSEVPRLALSRDDLASIFAREVTERRVAAKQLSSLSRQVECDEILAEAAIIERYTAFLK